MCLFNYFVFTLLASSIIVCIALPSLNDYSFPLFFMTAAYVAFYDQPDEPVTESDESLGVVIGRNILLIIFGILFVFGVFLAL